MPHFVFVLRCFNVRKVHNSCTRSILREHRVCLHTSTHVSLSFGAKTLNTLTLFALNMCMCTCNNNRGPSEQFWLAAAVSVQPLVTLVSTPGLTKRLPRKIAFWSLWHANDWAICWRQQAVELRTDAYECRSDVGLFSHFIRNWPFDPVSYRKKDSSVYLGCRWELKVHPGMDERCSAMVNYILAENMLTCHLNTNHAAAGTGASDTLTTSNSSKTGAHIKYLI